MKPLQQHLLHLQLLLLMMYQVLQVRRKIDNLVIEFLIKLINRTLHLIAKKDLNELDDNIDTSNLPNKYTKLNNGKSMLLGFELKFIVFIRYN
jgi:hypothetical protein